ncbi:MAG: hypothetical protein QOF14_5527 [Hyphomicrobiales bacterium]|jgi:hypothetical protein|nr:hypothetical protein [Hyphomicrobiales bacterium]
MKITSGLILGSAALALLIPHAAKGQGADVILGELSGTKVYASYNGIAALTVSTTSCNAGNQVLNWKALPDNKHPVITMNMYRLLDDRLTQIGQSWAKHGFVALQQNACGFGCQAHGGDGLGVGCSDPYGVGNNQGPNLGSRRLINPTTGGFDGAKAQHDLQSFQPTTPIDHGLQVRESDLGNPGARYFIEGHYIAADDAAAGNGSNNVSHMEVSITRDANGTLIITNTAPGPHPTVREVPSIRAWPYAEFSTHSAQDDGRITVAHKVTRITRTKYRYEYAVYNMNSERGVQSFSIPVGNALISNIGSSAVLSHGETIENDSWQSAAANGRVTWSTKTFQQSENANAIRWGTTYNFWFDAEAEPTSADATLARFKPGPGAATISLNVRTPKG